ncbi:MAG: terminase small subunit [Gammaproteobacteria bacterium]|nr:terminase small subunit [Gammaproteobacteria bacterium]
MRSGLTQKQENFTLDVFADVTPAKAYLTHYKCKPSAAYALASRLLTNAKIVDRISQLRKRVEDASVATVLERKQILTEIARGNLLDYQEVGADGGYLSIGKESPNTRAISEITSRTEYDKEGSGAALVTKVKLHSPSQAIDLLNKMEKIYSDGQPEDKSVKVQVNVINVDTKTVAAAILEAERLGLTPELLGGNGHSEDASILSSPADIQATTVPKSEN